MKRWKKFSGNELFAAILVEFFPYIAGSLDETLYYAFANQDDLLQLCFSALAAKVVFDTYGQLPSDHFDEMIMFRDDFHVYERTWTDFAYTPEFYDKYTIREFHVSPDAAKKLCDSICNAKLIDPPPEFPNHGRPEPEADYEEIEDSEPFFEDALFEPALPACKPGSCTLCQFLLLRENHTFAGLTSLPRSPTCRRICEARKATEPFTIDIDEERVKKYGSMFFRKRMIRVLGADDDNHEVETGTEGISSIPQGAT